MSNIAIHQIFKALSEPVRLRMLVMLTEGELCVCDLQRVLELPQSTLSRHMSRLKLLGLVADRRAGKWVHYRLADGGTEVQRGVRDLLAGLAATAQYREDMLKLQKYLTVIKCADEV